ncbi:uncharacterized protein SCHCODRAFT_01096922 [Schizophyllum commune H4-8]|uniref:Expressed protein n=1 Tax=Schizophyllum commune (strain H4-8 / FGSC 9210) TaxID=578458 RepID=D8Q7Y2_SCHCM|nr:uncharacterized protein SCHCODRAFT_01096922 [Schizophyllum commune H4-8]KAI5891293.1 hypothetical protein SCHCODRAFT_01096922 [Schizophyllum commune H4-8]
MRCVRTRRCPWVSLHAVPIAVPASPCSYSHAYNSPRPSHGLASRPSCPDELPAYGNGITVATHTTNEPLVGWSPPSSIPNTLLPVHSPNHYLTSASSAATSSQLQTPNNVAQIMPKPRSVIQLGSMQLANHCALRELGGQDCFVGKALSPAILCCSISTNEHMQIHNVTRRASVLCLCEG